MEPSGKFNWDELTAIAEGTGAGKKDGKWVLVNKKGEAKSDERFEKVIVDENGFCSKQKRIFVMNDGKYYIVDTKGEKVGELTFEDAKAFTEDGYAAVCSDGKWGFVDEDGKLVIDYTFENAQSFQNDYAAVCIDGLWGYIDEDGNQIIDPEFTLATHFSSKGTAVVQVESQGEKEWKLIQMSLFQ